MDHAQHVDLHHARPIAGLEIGERKTELSRADSGSVHDMIDRTEMLDGPRKRLLNGSLVGDVDLDAQGLHGVFAAQSLRNLECIAAQVPNRHVCAFAGESRSRCASDAAGTARDDGDAIFQPQVHVRPRSAGGLRRENLDREKKINRLNCAID